MDYDEYEKLISKVVDNYQRHKQKGRQSRDLYKKAIGQIEKYSQILKTNFAPNSRFQWLSLQTERLNKIKAEKNVVTDKEQAKKLVDQYDHETDQALKRLEPKLDQAIKVSTYIQIELERQIKELDNVYQESKEGKKRLRRAKKGLKKILQRAMLNKCTRFLAILTVLALIGVIVVYVLKDNGII